MKNEQIVYGWHAVKALLNNPYRIIKQVFVKSDRLDERSQTLVELAKEKNITINKVEAAYLDKYYGLHAHQGVVAIANPLAEYSEKDLQPLVDLSPKPRLILILDGITDTHNLGACLRTADASGVNFVIIPKDKSATPNATVAKIASGALENTPVVQVTNLARTINFLKQQGIWIYGAAEEARNNLYFLPGKQCLGLVMGAEGKGLRHLTRQCCDDLFSLPMFGQVESLNVSVATGISLYEIIRQRLISN